MYRGVAIYVSDKDRWRSDILDSITKPALSQDVLQLTRIDKDASDWARSKSSSPKLQALNTALVSVPAGVDFVQALRHGPWWRRLVKSAVSAHRHNFKKPGADLCCWQERNHEVDFVFCQGDRLTAIEVKSGNHKGALPGLKKFTEQFTSAKALVVGAGGSPLRTFLSSEPAGWL